MDFNIAIFKVYKIKKKKQNMLRIRNYLEIRLL